MSMNNPLQFTLEHYSDDWYFLVDIITKDVLDVEDITYDIYMIWNDKKEKQCLTLLPCSHPFYRCGDIRELAIEKVEKYIYEEKRKM